MGENPIQSPEATLKDESSGAETPDEKVHYELDLEEHAPADIDEAFKDAVAAVDRAKDGEPASDAEASSGEAAEPGGEAAGSQTDVTPSRAEPLGTPRDELESQTDGLRQRLMRTLADFDNYRKRTEREKQALRRFANFDVFKDFLGVLDNLERAMDSSGSAEDLKQGLKMIVRQHEEILRRHGVERVEAVGKAFDPTVHEAVAREESSDVELPTVTKEMQRGYLLHDRLLRPAMVFVSMPSGESAGKSADGGGADGDDGAGDGAKSDGEASG